VPEFCSLTKELGLIVEVGNLGDCDNPPCKVRQKSFYSEIVKWILPTRFLVREESQFQVKTRDPSSALGQYGEIEKEEPESDQPSSSYHVWFRAEGECELVPGDKSQVVNTRPVKKQDNKK